MSGRPTRTSSDDRGFGRYLEQAAIERTGHPEDADQGTEQVTEQPEEDTSKPPRTGRRGSSVDTGFARYLSR